MKARLSLLTVALLLAASPAARAADNKELNVLLVMDTNAGKRGGDMNAHRFHAGLNEKMWRDTVNSVYNSGPLFKSRLTLNVLRDDAVNPARIRQYYQQLPFSKDRALLLAYSGHGATDPQRGHFLATSGGDLSRSELIQLMTNRGAPAVFLLTDCCSSFAPMAQPSQESSDTPRQPKPANAQAFYNLFYQTQGLVDMTAAQRGQIALAGLFTTSLTEVLTQPSSRIRFDGRNGFVSWNDYFGRVSPATSAKWNGIRNGLPANHDLRRLPTQQPAMSITRLAGPAVTPNPAPTVRPAIEVQPAPTFRPPVQPPQPMEEPERIIVSD